MNAPRMLNRLIMISLISIAQLCAVSTTWAQQDTKVAARQHFDKGVAAYEERRFSDAVEEFETAFKLSRAFKILFNIGQVNVALGRPVEAVDAYDRYLKQGGATIAAERRKEVQIEIEHQIARIGTLVVRTTPGGADVRIDGALVGKSPLPRAVRIAMGRHTVEAILPKHAPQLREVDVAGRAELAVELTLEPFLAPTPAIPAPPPATPVVPLVIMSSPPPNSGPQGDYSASRTASLSPRSDASGSSLNWQRIVGSLLAVGGLGTATIGGVLAYKGTNQTNDARDRLTEATNTGDTAAYDLAKPDFDAGRHRTQTGWTVAGIGAAGLVGGILLVAIAPERSTNVALAPWTIANAGGLALGGAW